MVLLLTLVSIAAPPNQSNGLFKVQKAMTVDNQTYIDANRILMFVTNHGNFARDLAGVFGYDYGTFYPYSGDISAIIDQSADDGPLYASGLWIGGKDSETGDVHVIVAEYNDEYVPGPMVGGTFLPDEPAFRSYKLFSDSMWNNPNEDWTDFPHGQDGNPDHGAPWKWYYTAYDDDGLPIDSVVGPDMIGDQMIWAVYNDANPDQHNNNSGETDPMGIEVKQTTFAFDREGALGDIIAIKFQVFNKGDKTFDSCFFSLWADPDLGNAGDDLVGCDTTLSLGYCYNGDQFDDNHYLETPPAIGYDFFQGPLRAVTGDDEPLGRIYDTISTDPLDIDSSQFFYGKMWGVNWTDSANLGMYSFNKYINGTDPDDFNETYNYMRGLNRDGTDYTYLGVPSRYVATGDPVANTGDIDIDQADRRFMLSTGPVTFAPGDSTEIVAAIIVGRGADNFNSITVLKDLDLFAQLLYESDFNPPKAPARPNLEYAQLPEETVLYWDDTSEVDQGDYIFEGYTVWQGETTAGPWRELATYDLINGITDALIDTVKDGNVTLAVIKRKLKNNGLRRYYPITQDIFDNVPLRNGKEYYFRVTAFSFSDTLPNGNRVPNGDRFLESSAVLTIVPGMSSPTVTPANGSLDTLEVTHVGGGDGIVYPIVTDPLALTGDDYMIFFEDDVTLGWVWYLVNTTTGDTLLAQQTNQTGDEDYFNIDGFLLKVIGPAFGVKSIQEIANGGGVLATPDNVMYSLNSTADWYVDSDVAADFSRMNWRGHIGTWDWEMRFTAAGSQYYDWNTDILQGDFAPFEWWNIGIGTPDDAGDDMQINFSFIDDAPVTGAWGFGDRLYPWDVQYVEPAPAVPPYNFDADFHIGRIRIQDYSGALTAPAEGTIIRFTTNKISTEADTFTFSTAAPEVVTSGSSSVLDDIKVVPNPFYLRRASVATHDDEVMFRNLPPNCTISIFNLGGDLVRVLDRTNPANPYEYWDLTSDRGLPVASGIYIYVVEAPGFGNKVGKMAIIASEERLPIY